MSAATRKPLTRGLAQQSQLDKNASGEWLSLVFPSYVDQNPFSGSTYTLFDVRHAETSAWDKTVVFLNRIDELLLPISVSVYFYYFLNFFGASSFRHWMCLDGHSAETGDDNRTRLRCPSSCLRRWIYCGGRGAAMYRSMSARIDSSFVNMNENAGYNRQLSVTIVWYIGWIDSDDTSTLFPVLDLEFCCMYFPPNYCWLTSFWQLG